LAHLARRWARPEPKRTATARAGDLRARATLSSPAAVVPPAGGGPMTGRQAHYLAGLAARAGEEADATLTRLEATERITELQQRFGRSPPPWAHRLAEERAAQRASGRPEETAQFAAARLFETRTGLRTETVRPEPVAARLAEARSRLRKPGEVTEALDVSAEEAIEALAVEGRLAAEDALHPEPLSFQPPPMDFSPEGREAETEVARELSRERSRERGSPRHDPGVGLGR
ncbi:MAG TPA: DUF3072 domain-containing protein, partial [Anaeromyxobacteraceae bacterium]|nr:DUF3072 domain-containing protein [Anaeromyxobacteraceae bacterium]